MEADRLVEEFIEAYRSEFDRFCELKQEQDFLITLTDHQRHLWAFKDLYEVSLKPLYLKHAVSMAKDCKDWAAYALADVVVQALFSHANSPSEDTKLTLSEAEKALVDYIRVNFK